MRLGQSPLGDLQNDKYRAHRWAKSLLDLDARDWIIFDTATTGLLEDEPEIVQVGLLWPDGTVALDTLVHPMGHIPEQATAIHGITDEMVANAPVLSELLDTMKSLMHGRRVVVYNAPYDREVLYGCLERRMAPTLGTVGKESEVNDRAQAWIDACQWDCAMQQYAAYYGDWSPRRGAYKWQKLPPIADTSARPGETAHTAIGDCRATLALIERMAKPV